MKRRKSPTAPAGNLRPQAEKRLKEKGLPKTDDLSRTDARSLVYELQVHQIELEMQNEELRQAQVEAQEARQKYTELFDFAPVGYFLVDQAGKIREANLAGAALVGRDRSQVSGQSFAKFIAPDSRLCFDTFWSHLRETDTRQSCELRLLKQGQSVRPVVLEATVRSVLPGGGMQLLLAVTDITTRKHAEDALKAVLHDLERRVEERTAELQRGNVRLAQEIEERKRADEELRESEARLNLTADAAAVGLWRLDLVTNSFWLTNKSRELFGLAKDGVVTFERFLTQVHPDDRELIRQTVKTLVQSKSEGEVEYRVVRPDGSPRYIFSRGRIHCDGSGEPEYLMGVSLDVSERIESERETGRNRAEIAHLARAAMLGELSGSLAHELNQPLTAILSNAEAALGFLADGSVNLEEVRDILKDIVIDDERAGEVIRRLRLLLKKGEVHHLPLDLNEVAQDVLKTVRHDLLSHEITLQTELAPDLPAVKGDRVQLQQVLLNLILNAADAMASTAPAERHLKVRTEHTREGGVRVSVRDQGSGLAPEARKRIFEPFFTTKSKGMGLGLKVCRTIIAAHGGQIGGDNNPEQGATFHFELPTAKRNPA